MNKARPSAWTWKCRSCSLVQIDDRRPGYSPWCQCGCIGGVMGTALWGHEWAVVATWAAERDMARQVALRLAASPTSKLKRFIDWTKGRFRRARLRGAPVHPKGPRGA